MRMYTITTLRSCFSAFWQLHSMQQYLSQHALPTLIWSLVISKVDYWCCLQRVLNTSPSYSTTFTGCKLQSRYDSTFVLWHTAVSTVQFYTTLPTSSAADIKGRRHLHSVASTTLTVPPIRWSTLGDRALRRCSVAVEQFAISLQAATSPSDKKWRQSIDLTLSTTEPTLLLVLSVVIH